jgi:hypothetical protein
MRPLALAWVLGVLTLVLLGPWLQMPSSVAGIALQTYTAMVGGIAVTHLALRWAAPEAA